jgi:NAD(P)H dehydrogenase (quinone)
VLTSATAPEAVYELAGDAAFTLAELAAELSRQSGKAIAFQNMPQADYRAMLVSVGLPAPLADLIADSDACAAQGALDDDSHVLSKLIGRSTQTLAEAVKAAL